MLQQLICQAPWLHDTLRTLDLLRQHAEGLVGLGALEALPADLDVMGDGSDGLPPGCNASVMGEAVGRDGFTE